MAILIALFLKNGGRKNLKDPLKPEMTVEKEKSEEIELEQD